MKSKIIFLATVGTLLSSFLFTSPAPAATRGTRPGEPRNVVAIAGENSVTVLFMPPSSNGGYRVNRYVIKTYPTNRVYNCPSTNCHIGDLEAGTPYFFQVAAVSKVGRGAYSSPSKVVTPSGSVTITFNANGGSGSMASETEPYNTTAALTTNTFTYVGYTFTGWSTTANGSGTAFANGALAKFNGSATFYAQWAVASAPTSATVTFNANGGVGTMAPETENLNVSTTLTTNTFTRTGYTFSSWNTAPNGGGASYGNDAPYSFVASMTLYAQWTAIPAPVPFTGTISSNWSGYVFPSGTILTQATAEWVVPHLNCADTPNAQAGTWVGIGGVTWPTGGTSGPLFQTGTGNNCVNGVQEESAWFELFPYMSTYSLIYSDFRISAGDTILGKVGLNTKGQWVAVLEDLTTGIQGVYGVGIGWDVSTIATNSLIVPLQQYGSGWSYSGGYSADWIVEPGTSLANYGSEAFTDLGTSIPSWSLSASDAQELVQNDVTLSVPGADGIDGFTVAYVGP